MKRLIVFGVLAALLGIQAQARANLLVNGSFQTGDLTGWTDGGNTGWNSVVGGGPDADGFQVSNGAVGSPSLLSQTVPTTPGGLYQISFWVQNDGGGTFNVVFDGTTVYSEGFVGHPYTQHTVFGVASGSSTVLQLQTQDNPGFIQFDEISVDPSGANPIPEPASLALLGMGVAGLAGYAWRRRRRVALA